MLVWLVYREPFVGYHESYVSKDTKEMHGFVLDKLRGCGSEGCTLTVKQLEMTEEEYERILRWN